MAKKKKAKPALTDKAKFLAEMLERYRRCVEFENDNRKCYRDDMKFALKPGEQWDPVTKTARGQDRPMYEFNHVKPTGKGIINEMRSNRPSLKVRGVEDSDKHIAEAREGICKNIWNNSDGDSVIDYAADHQVFGGYAAWRIETKYVNAKSFNQDIVISSEQNPLCVYADYACKDPMKRDARFWFRHTQIPEDEYEAKYPDRDVEEFEPDEIMDDVADDGMVWIAEYYVRKDVMRQLQELSDGSIVEAGSYKSLPDGIAVVDTRAIPSYEWCSYIVSRDSILSDAQELPGTMAPFVVVYGDYTVVDGKVQWGGIVQNMRDPQRAHNWAMTGVYESIASAPNAKYWATPKQAEGQAAHWKMAVDKNLPVMLYNNDSAVPGPPPRVGGPDVPVALMQAASMSTDEMKACSGVYDASLGARSNETSGKAIANRAAQGAMATFNYQDNMLKGVRRTYEIMLDWMPDVYDTHRVFRILGADGSEKLIEVNKVDPVTGEIINDLSQGNYDIALTAGPSFATQRMEAADVFMGLAQGNPQVMAGAGDLVFKALDTPMSEQFAERMRLMLPPQIQASINKDKPLPPEAQAALMQAQQAMDAVAHQGQLVQQAAQEVQADKATADKAKADVQLQVAQLKVQEANLATDVANFKTLVAQTEAKMAQAAASQGNETEKMQLGAQLQDALGAITQQSAQLFQQYAAQLTNLTGQALQATQPQVVVARPPMRKIARSRRINGELHTEIEELPMAAGAN